MAPSPTWPALIATARGALWRAADGTVERLAGPAAALRAAGSLPLVCHAPAVAARLGLDNLAARDLLELYAFVRPATFCLPTPRGLCEALDLALPTTPEEELARLPDAAKALLDELEDMAALASPDLKDTATAMARGQWAWGDAVLEALGIGAPAKKPRPGAGLDVWKSLPQWEEPPPAPPPGSEPVDSREARLDVGWQNIGRQREPVHRLAGADDALAHGAAAVFCRRSVEQSLEHLRPGAHRSTVNGD